MTLPHLVRRAAVPSPRPPLLVLLHGLGADERDLFGLAPYLDPRFVVVSVRAPRLAEPMGYSWYDIDWTRVPRRVDEEQARESRDRLARFLPEACASLGADASRVWLMGFSQGAFLSAALALGHPRLVRGFAGHSGGLLPRLVPDAPPPGFEGLPVLLQHGQLDDVVPLSAGEEARDRLEELGARVDWREHAIGHEISGDSLVELVRWLSARLDEAGPG